MDIITILTDQADYKKVRNYWKWLKNKLNAEGSEVVSSLNARTIRSIENKKHTNKDDETSTVAQIATVPTE